MSRSLDAPRHPLGLPRGSVRALLALQIAVTFWLLLLLPEAKRVPVPLNLYFLLALVLLFFVSHGTSIATRSDPEPSPLWLPGGSIRFLIVAGTVAVIAYQYQQNKDALLWQLTPTASDLTFWPNYMLATIAGFAVGYVTRVMPFRTLPFFQTLTAWVSIVAMLLMLIESVIEVLIRPQSPVVDNLETWKSILTGIVAFYYAKRS